MTNKSFTWTVVSPLQTNYADIVLFFFFTVHNPTTLLCQNYISIPVHTWLIAHNQI